MGIPSRNVRDSLTRGQKGYSTVHQLSSQATTRPRTECTYLEIGHRSLNRLLIVVRQGHQCHHQCIEPVSFADFSLVLRVIADVLDECARGQSRAVVIRVSVCAAQSGMVRTGLLSPRRVIHIQPCGNWRNHVPCYANTGFMAGYPTLTASRER